MTTYKLYEVEFTVWEDDARLPSSGVFRMPAENKDDLFRAIEMRWPTMIIIDYRELK